MVENIDKKIIEIKETLRSGAVLSPEQLSENLRILSGHYAFRSDAFAKYEIARDEEIEKFREDCNSDAQAGRRFTIYCDDGKNYIRVKRELKALEKLISALKSTISIEQNNWRNANN